MPDLERRAGMIRESDLRKARYRVLIQTTLGDLERKCGPGSTQREIREVRSLAQLVVEACKRELKCHRRDPALQRESAKCEMCDGDFRRMGSQKRCYPCIQRVPTRRWCTWKRVGIEHARKRAREGSDDRRA